MKEGRLDGTLLQEKGRPKAEHRRGNEQKKKLRKWTAKRT